MEWRCAFWIVCLIAFFDVAICATEKNDKEDEVDKNSVEYILQHPEHPDFYSVGWNDTDYKLIKATEDLVKKIMPIIIRQSSEITISGPCMAALFKMLLAFKKQKVWAYRCMYNSLLLVIYF